VLGALIGERCDASQKKWGALLFNTFCDIEKYFSCRVLASKLLSPKERIKNAVLLTETSLIAMRTTSGFTQLEPLKQRNKNS